MTEDSTSPPLTAAAVARVDLAIPDGGVWSGGPASCLSAVRFHCGWPPPGRHRLPRHIAFPAIVRRTRMRPWAYLLPDSLPCHRAGGRVFAGDLVGWVSVWVSLCYRVPPDAALHLLHLGILRTSSLEGPGRMVLFSVALSMLSLNCWIGLDDFARRSEEHFKFEQ